MPLSSSTDIIKAAANDIIQALENPSAQSPLAPITDSESAATKTLASIIYQRCPPTDTPTDVPAPAPTPMETTLPSESSSPTTLHRAPTPNDNPRTTATVRPYPTSFGDIEERYDSIIIDAGGEDHFDTNCLVRRSKTTPSAPIPEKPGKILPSFVHQIQATLYHQNNGLVLAARSPSSRNQSLLSSTLHPTLHQI